eukprot:6186037-Pleurochrysis_carterae.AAC.3
MSHRRSRACQNGAGRCRKRERMRSEACRPRRVGSLCKSGGRVAAKGYGGGAAVKADDKGEEGEGGEEATQEEKSRCEGIGRRWR